MQYQHKVILYHCLEWLLFWWQNQTECDWPQEPSAEYAYEFAAHWWSMEKDAYEGADDPGSVNYSAGVFCELIDDPICERTEADIDRIIARDISLFKEITSHDYTVFMPKNYL